MQDVYRENIGHAVKYAIAQRWFWYHVGGRGGGKRGIAF
jgi:hypothetical protein